MMNIIHFTTTWMASEAGEEGIKLDTIHNKMIRLSPKLASRDTSDHGGATNLLTITLPSRLAPIPIPPHTNPKHHRSL